MNVVKNAVTGCALAGAGLVIAAVTAGSALASTTVGQTGPPLTNSFLEGGAEWLQASTAMPASGVVTSLNTQAGTCGGGGGVYDLQVLRPLGGGQFQVLGDTGTKTDPCDGQLHSYPVSIAVQAGDVIGAYVVSSAWQGVLSETSGTINAVGIPQPAAGDTFTVDRSERGTLDESATLASTSEVAAAKLVSDTKGVAPGTALSDKATAIQAAVTAGNTPAACAGITDFRGLVKAQTGKKLTSAQAGLLTTDADTLATALGC